MADRLDRMRRNPQGDWRMSDIEAVCRERGVACETPRRGSHHKVTHPRLPDHVTIPARRPIKAVYIRELIEFIDRAEATDVSPDLPRRS